MKIIFEITLYEVLFILISIIGGCFALFQWKQSYKLKRAELIKEAMLKIRDDTDISLVLYSIDYGDNWYNQEFAENHTIEAQYDKVFAFFDYLCYLYNTKILTKNEFRIFEYRIKRMQQNSSFRNYLFNLYHFSKRNYTDISFYNLLDYLNKEELIDKEFWNVNSKKYNKILNI